MKTILRFICPEDKSILWKSDNSNCYQMLVGDSIFFEGPMFVIIARTFVHDKQGLVSLIVDIKAKKPSINDKYLLYNFGFKDYEDRKFN